MHELSLAQSLIDIVEDYGRREGFARVRSLKLSFGRLSCIEPDSFRFVFSVQARNTKADGARLEFDILPAVLYCLRCEQEFSSEVFQPDCPCCKGHDVLLTGGTQEMKLLEMDVD
ncbi:MAG: hydrogenase maturation nickel metallochaperone HypA [Deltaproteobacteria bacterium]|nr:hydrogenase maturation nickel metallochaperone HypA [Deltaproteobacteria bacterium]